MASIEIDGSIGEGGGQILRTAVALSAVTGKAVFVKNIRANRIEPGIRPSHMAAVDAVRQICNGFCNAKIGDTEMEFKPEKIQEGKIDVNIDTAGSIPLVLQAIMIPLALVKDTEVEIRGGGTATRWSPTIGYVQNVTLPLLEKIGYKGTLEIIRQGFYPKGGAHVIFTSGKTKLKPIEGFNPGKIIGSEGIGTVTKDLKKNDVGERLKTFARDKLFKKFRVVPRVGYEYVDSLSTGSAVDVFVRTENTIWGANALGETRKRIEYVVDEAINDLAKQARHNHFLDEHMADQIMPYMALAKKSSFSVTKITDHARTNAFVIEKFLPVKFSMDEKYKVISVK